jgi:hypothetical protein
MAGLSYAPVPLVVFGIACTALGAVLLVVLLWHVARRLLDIPRVPRGPGSYVLLVVACLALVVCGLGALTVAAALDDWQAVPVRGALAEVQCHRLSPTSARLSLIPLRDEGSRGAEEVETVDAIPCEVAVERLRFIPALARFGLLERHRVARIGGRRRPLTTPSWRALPEPLGVPVAVASDHQLSVPVDEGGPYRVMADERGLRVER